ncbi:hypothetical protein HK097_003565 [Rhizophlyctis rosea]|uniref:Uncharacterized protein n=1 Tax=Rhizophlyctis rosea TaxID=64517 RepID=A0AAD5SHY4_9FUNG|nr:hypothetical protein HK097_003565 [Rhizophlyctis rosea]
MTILGTIGNLYRKEPFTSYKATIPFPLIDLPHSSEMDPTDAIDRALGFNYGPLYLQGVIDHSSVLSHCEDKACTGKATSVLHPLLVSALESNYSLQDAEWQRLDRVTGRVRTATTIVECKAREDVSLVVGEGVAEIEVTGMETALATRVVDLVQSDTPLERYNFSQMEHQPAAQVIVNAYGYLNCASAFCPLTEGRVPYFDDFTGLLPQPSLNTPFPYQTGMSTAVQALARLGTSRLASLCTTSSNTSAQSNAKITAPYLRSQINTTTACNAIILAGATCGWILAIMEIVAWYLGDGLFGVLWRTMETMQTVYGLVGVLDADERLLRTNSAGSGKRSGLKSVVEPDSTSKTGAEMYQKWRKGLEGRMVRVGNGNRSHLFHRSEPDVENIKIEKSVPIFEEEQGVEFRRRSEVGHASVE